MIRSLSVLLFCLASAADALDLTLTGAVESARVESPADSVRLPNAAWSPESVAPEVEGAITRTVQQIANPAMTTLQLIEPLRRRLIEKGYREVFTCADTSCGGFDFRFQLDLLPAPDMFVDLGNYRYFLADHESNAPSKVSIVASASSSAAYVHVTEVSEVSIFEFPLVQQEVTEDAPQNEGLISDLVAVGHVLLPDLDFGTGSSELGTGPYASLRSLASWLSQTPGARIVLVGHTDAVGSLEANAALSRRRANSVRDRLIAEFAIAPAQVAAEGAGALAPLASNLTSEGRAENRRVEVVLLGIE
ncbi:MAG: OmpA family protein [Pseudomonadota bacterium]